MKYSKLTCLIVVTLWQFIFLAKHSNAQFHWGKNYKFEADELMSLLEAYAKLGGNPLHEHAMVSKTKEICNDNT